MTEKRNVLLAITGGVAAYKAVTVASRLHQAGLNVQVCMTKSATEFVGPLTFNAVTNNNVLCTLMPEKNASDKEDIYPHLYPATKADAFCLLPATSNAISKIAKGIGDDIVSTSALSLQKYCYRYVCPAMNVEMWEQPALQQDLDTMRSQGWQQIGPESGNLACGMTGFGRMAEPETIVERILSDLNNFKKLDGKRILVTSGPTQEHFDSVRYLSNHSSGKMGKAIAESLIMAGADVEFVTGPVDHLNLPRSPHIKLTPIMSAREMLAACEERYQQCDAAIFVAAVADYRPKNPSDKKIKKLAGGTSIELTVNPDIAATIGNQKAAHQRNIGFAMETHNGNEFALQKLNAKNLDAIILNGKDSFGAATGHFSCLQQSAIHEWGRVSKEICASNIVDLLDKLFSEKNEQEQ